MPNERRRRADVIRLIVSTRERFPHTPALTEAMRRVIWRYALPVNRVTTTRKPSRLKRPK